MHVDTKTIKEAVSHYSLRDATVDGFNQVNAIFDGPFERVVNIVFDQNPPITLGTPVQTTVGPSDLTLGGEVSFIFLVQEIATGFVYSISDRYITDTIVANPDIRFSKTANTPNAQSSGTLSFWLDSASGKFYYLIDIDANKLTAQRVVFLDSYYRAREPA